MTKREDEDAWQAMECQFHEMEALVRDFRLPEKVDIELLQLALQVDGTMELEGNGHFHAQSAGQMVEIAGCLAALGLYVPQVARDILPIRAAQGEKLQEQLLLAFQKREATPEFSFMWGRYNFLCARLIAWMVDEDIQQYESANVLKNMPNMVERVIYAYWMQAHWICGDMKKEAANEALAEKIYELKENETSMPEWKKQALERMLPENELGIVSTYTVISGEKIKVICEKYERWKHLFII